MSANDTFYNQWLNSTIAINYPVTWFHWWSSSWLCSLFMIIPDDQLWHVAIFGNQNWMFQPMTQIWFHKSSTHSDETIFVKKMDLINEYCLSLALCFQHWLLHFFPKIPSLTHFDSFSLCFQQRGNILIWFFWWVSSILWYCLFCLIIFSSFCLYCIIMATIFSSFLQPVILSVK